MKKKYFRSVYRKGTPLFFTCEHATAKIPAPYGTLGLTRKELRGGKDVVDHGSLAVMKLLAQSFGASWLYTEVSRVFIDHNRQLDLNPINTFHASALKQQLLTEVDGEEKIIDVPVNNKNPKAEEKRRFQKYVVPYQKYGTALAGRIKKQHGHAHMVQIHSFFPFYDGEERDIDIAVLCRADQVVAAKKLAQDIRKHTNLIVGVNRPWDISAPDAPTCAFDNLMDDADVHNFVIEINHKHILTKKGQKNMAKILRDAIVHNMKAL